MATKMVAAWSAGVCVGEGRCVVRLGIIGSKRCVRNFHLKTQDTINHIISKMQFKTNSDENFFFREYLMLSLVS